MRKITIFLTLSALLLAAAASFAQNGETAPEEGKTLRVEIEPYKEAQPIPNEWMAIIDEESAKAVQERWEKLRSGINRPHDFNDPPASEISPSEIRPWAPQADTVGSKMGGDPFLLEVNTTPSSAATGFSSTVNEPSVAGTGDYVFYTGNWYGAASTNGGQSWMFVNPFTGPFPEPAGQSFCCDQQVAHDDATDTVFWLQQIIPDTSADSSTQRINVDQNADGTWDCNYDIVPADGGFPDASLLDFPDLAVSDQHLFMSTNVFPNGAFPGAFAARLSLADITACNPTTADIYVAPAGFFSFRLTQGAGDTMYFADHASTTSIRVWSWPQANATPTSVIQPINAFLTGTKICPGPDNRDWCGFIDSRILAGAVAGNRVAFFWVGRQTEAGGFPFPYTQGVVMDASLGMVVLEQPLIWSPDAAWVYPSAGANSNGDFGGTIMWGGGSFFPNCSAWLVDDENGDSFSPFEHERSITGSSGPSSNRSGDYLSTRSYHPDDLGYVGTCFSYGTPTAGTSRYVLFGRESVFREDIFVDGFESGNVTLWTTSVPAP